LLSQRPVFNDGQRLTVKQDCPVLSDTGYATVWKRRFTCIMYTCTQWHVNYVYMYKVYMYTMFTCIMCTCIQCIFLMYSCMFTYLWCIHVNIIWTCIHYTYLHVYMYIMFTCICNYVYMLMMSTCTPVYVSRMINFR